MSWSNSVPASGVNSGMASVVDHTLSHLSVTKFEKTSSKYCLKGTYLLPETKGGCYYTACILFLLAAVGSLGVDFK